MFRKFHDRMDAGQRLAEELAEYAGKADILVLALPRGGVPVAHEVAKALSLPMDIWLVRKLGVPGHEELAMGALSVDGVRYIHQDTVADLKISDEQISRVVERESRELQRRNKLYRQNRPPPAVRGKTVIIIDDGLATGATMRAAVDSLRQSEAKYIIAAVPVGAISSCGQLAVAADKIICHYMPPNFYGVGQWYEDFSQTSDEEVQNILAQHASPVAAHA